MPDYSKAKIYQLVSLVSNDVYIGSTCQSLKQRLAEHRSHYKSHKKGTHEYCHSFKIIESGSYDIYLLEAYPCNNKDELHAKEGEYVRSMVCVNKQIPNRNRKQWAFENADYISSNNKKKRFICECGSNIRLDGKADHLTSSKHIDHKILSFKADKIQIDTLNFKL